MEWPKKILTILDRLRCSCTEHNSWNTMLVE